LDSSTPQKKKSWNSCNPINHGSDNDRRILPASAQTQGSYSLVKQKCIVKQICSTQNASKENGNSRYHSFWRLKAATWVNGYSLFF
jgi:hypothetical protein